VSVWISLAECVCVVAGNVLAIGGAYWPCLMPWPLHPNLLSLIKRQALKFITRVVDFPFSNPSPAHPSEVLRTGGNFCDIN